MIKVPTVLILGAGASNEAGDFPLGRGLVEHVWENLTSGEYLHIYKTLIELSHKTELANFRDQLHKSVSKSVDAFLQARNSFETIGKMTMAAILLWKEQHSTTKLRKPGENSWCRIILDELDSDGFDRFHENRLSVVTFNYDRSFEYLLHEAMMARHSETMPPEELRKRLKGVQVIHVYGSLGKLPWQADEGQSSNDIVLQYGAKITHDAISRSAKSIKVIGEGDENAAQDPEFNAARRLINKAKRIYFLGFGYHATNVKRLELGESLKALQDGSKIMQGTSYGLTHKERRGIRDRLLDGRAVLSEHDSYNCLWWLREEVGFA